MSTNTQRTDDTATTGMFDAMPMPHDHPRLIFFTDGHGGALLDVLHAPDVLDTLAARGWGVALGVSVFDAGQAVVARLLHERGVSLVAWLLLPPEQGLAFNSQNYPQAAAHYRAFREWVATYNLHFDAVGIEIAPPAEVARADDLSPRRLARRFWRAGENMLFPTARAAYIELIAAIRHDGYLIHAYQLPFVADDRRAGTTLVQRALEIVDVAADVDVLLCSSAVPIERLRGDLRGALIASYGPSADAIAVGGAMGAGDDVMSGPLPWHALERDLLLAAVQTDIIYVDSLEACVERGLLQRIAALDWSKPVRAALSRRLVVSGLRGLLCVTLISARFGPRAIAWAGWVLALLMWVRGRRRRRL